MQDEQDADREEEAQQVDATFDAVFESFRGLLAARIRGRLPPAILRRVSIADVLQETHLAALEKKDRVPLDDLRAFKSWVLTIADHKAIEHLRRHGKAAKRSVRREVTRAGRPATASLPLSQPSPSEIAVAAETLERIRRVRASLPVDHAEVLRLAREEGVPLREVALRMDRSYEAVKKLYGRALRSFRELFESLEEESRDG